MPRFEVHQQEGLDIRWGYRILDTETGEWLGYGLTPEDAFAICERHENPTEGTA
jgi:transposase